MTPVVALPALTAEELEFLALAVDRRCGHLSDLVSLRLTPWPGIVAVELSVGRSLQSKIAKARERLAGQ